MIQERNKKFGINYFYVLCLDCPAARFGLSVNVVNFGKNNNDDDVDCCCPAQMRINKILQ